MAVLKEDNCRPSGASTGTDTSTDKGKRAGTSADRLTVLDVASGEGRFTKELHTATKPARIIAVDNYLPYMKTAKQKYSDINQAQCVGNLYRTALRKRDV